MEWRGRKLGKREVWKERRGEGTGIEIENEVELGAGGNASRLIERKNLSVLHELTTKRECRQK